MQDEKMLPRGRAAATLSSVDYEEEEKEALQGEKGALLSRSASVPTQCQLERALLGMYVSKWRQCRAFMQQVRARRRCLQNWSATV